MANKPKWMAWFKVYCLVLGLCYLFVLGLSFFFFLADPAELGMPPIFAKWMGFLFFGLGFVLMIVAVLPLFFRPKPWLYYYDLVLICLGLTSCCFWPICIPLLVFWIKPETKDHFHPKT